MPELLNNIASNLFISSIPSESDAPVPGMPKQAPPTPQREYQEQTETIEAVPTGLSSKVILFNDEIHTFEEVTQQIIKAIKCSEDQAESLTWEVHSKGKTRVYDGEMGECLRVSGILEEIDLITQIEY